MSDSQSTPTQVIKRNAYGLLDNVKYVFNERGFIEWRKMVKDEFLVANKQNFERRKATIPENVQEIEDKDLLILLGGIKELAQIRGLKSVSYDIKSPSPDYVVAACSITWIPNYETEGQEITFSAIGDASPNNTTNFARCYLGPIAENRSFVRCVRNFLKINVVSQEEIGGVKIAEEIAVSNDFNPKALLAQIMKDKGVSFETIKGKLLKENYDKADSFAALKDIPNVKIFELIERLQKIK